MPPRSGEPDEKPLNSAEEKKTGEITKAEIEAIKSGLHSNPFALLGVHETPEGFSARCFISGAEEVSVLTLDGNFIGELKRLDPEGFSKVRSSLHRASRCVTAPAATMPNGR